MVLEGVDIRQDGPQSGLVWMKFDHWQFHGAAGTPEYYRFHKQKGEIIAKAIANELTLGTRHFNSRGKLLKTIEEILHSYSIEKGVYVDLDPRRRKMKLEPLAKKYGIRGLGHDGSNPDRRGPDLGDQRKPS